MKNQTRTNMKYAVADINGIGGILPLGYRSRKELKIMKEKGLIKKILASGLSSTQAEKRCGQEYDAC